MKFLAHLANIKEGVVPLGYDEFDIEDMLIELEKRFAAARRGLAFANKLKDPTQKKKHLSRVITNMNMIRAQLQRVTKQIQQFSTAECEYANATDLGQVGQDSGGGTGSVSQ